MRKLQKFVLFLLFIFFVLLIFHCVFKISYSNDAVATVQTSTLLPNENLNSDSFFGLKDFKYLIRSHACRKKENLLGVILVHSYVGNDQLRSAHRKAISQKELLDMGLLRIFMLAQIPPREKFVNQSALDNESIVFGDLVQGNFLEAYRNLTYKHLMALKYAVEDCSDARYLIKMDDDIVVDYFRLQILLKSLDSGVEDYLLQGFILDNEKPNRNQANKWFVAKEEYGQEKFPKFLSGWLYITNPRTARDLLSEAEMTPFFWIDDILVTGIVAERLGIRLERINDLYSPNAEFLDCCIRDVSRYSVECDFVFGPNGGDSGMIVEFMEAMRKCVDGKCSKRGPERELKKTCVARLKDFVNDRGHAVIQEIRL